MKRKQPAKLISEVPTEPIHVQKVAFWRQMPLSEALSQNWLVLGSINQIGAKAEELMRKEKAISEAGFTTYPRVALAMDFVEPFLKRSGVNEKMGGEKAKVAIKKTEFTKSETKQIMDAIGMLGLGFPVVRSSAHGDATGTGIYKSVIVGKKSHEKGFEALVLHAIKQVLASHYAEGARIFREKLALASGIAVIIEPAFAEPMKNTMRNGDGFTTFAFESCQFGGIGRTSETNIYGKKEEAIYISAGLPSKVVGWGEGVRISPDDFAHGGSSIRDFEKNKDYMGMDAAKLIRYRRIIEAICWGEVISGEGGIYNSDGLNNGTFREPLETLIFGKLRKLESILGAPQYIEFGVRQIGGKTEVACFQIADEKTASKGKVELYQKGERLIRSDIVIGKGVFDSNMLVALLGSSGVHDLYHFNQNNKGYILAYSGNILTYDRVDITYVGNASVLAEYIAYVTHENLASHWGGLQNVLGKLLMGMSGNDGAYWIDKLECVEKKDDFMVFKGDFRAVSDGRQAVIYNMGKKK